VLCGPRRLGLGGAAGGGALCEEDEEGGGRWGVGLIAPRLPNKTSGPSRAGRLHCCRALLFEPHGLVWTLAS